MTDASSRRAADGPPICTLCFWPVELWHPVAKHDGRLVHALCLDQRERRALGREGSAMCAVCDKDIVAGMSVVERENLILHLACLDGYQAKKAVATTGKPSARTERPATKRP